MDEDNIGKTNAILSQYGGYITHINYNMDYYPIYYGLNPNSIPSSRRNILELKIEFNDSSAAYQFFKDTEMILKNREEIERINTLHTKHQTLKDAYEQYQLLLKLYQ